MTLHSLCLDSCIYRERAVSDGVLIGLTRVIILEKITLLLICEFEAIQEHREVISIPGFLFLSILDDGVEFFDTSFDCI